MIFAWLTAWESRDTDAGLMLRLWGEDASAAVMDTAGRTRSPDQCGVWLTAGNREVGTRPGDQQQGHGPDPEADAEADPEGSGRGPDLEGDAEGDAADPDARTRGRGPGRTQMWTRKRTRTGKEGTRARTWRGTRKRTQRPRMKARGFLPNLARDRFT